MTQPAPLSILILAAGKGTRMKSDKAKVLHEVFFVPMLCHVLESIKYLNPQHIAVVIGHQKESVQTVLKNYPVQSVVQEQQLGTGHAVLAAERNFADFHGTLMILCGDTPLIRPETLADMYTAHRIKNSVCTLMTTHLTNPANYGRILKNASGQMLGIIEEKDASAEQKKINEINAGIYCVECDELFPVLHTLTTANAQGEFYLTDIIGKMVASGKQVDTFACPYPNDVLGVNSRVELAEAHKEIQRRRNIQLMQQGVSFFAPDSTTVSFEAFIGKDCVIEPCVTISGKSRIGSGSIIRQGSIIQDCTIGADTVIGPYSILDSCSIPDNTSIPAQSNASHCDFALVSG